MRTLGAGRSAAAGVSCALALLLGSSVGFAQVERPPVFVWSTGGHPVSGGVYADTRDFHAMSRPYNAGPTFDILTLDGARDAAKLAAIDVKRRLQLASTHPDHLEPGEVCLSLKEFGREMELDCDNAAVRGRQIPALSGDGEWMNSPLRFFVEGDRLPLNALAQGPDIGVPANSSGDDQTFGFPTPRDARTYRNPVKLANAREGAPLAAWMDAFCDRYEAIRLNPAMLDEYQNVTLPIPARFYLDKEPVDWIASVGDPNTFWMLLQLIRSETENGGWHG